MSETTTTTKKKKTVYLSDRRPVQICVDDWPIIANVDDHDGRVECQANNVWTIMVREHNDGRRIVYGWHESGNGGQHIGFRPTYGGFMVPPVKPGAPDEDETVRSIRRVAGMIERADLGAECIADLPAEVI